MDKRAMEAAQASYRRACAAPDFFAQFYRTFFAACPEGRARFANTDFTRQHKLLHHAIGLLLIFPNQPPGEPGLLTRLAERHSRRGLGIAPTLYAPFIDALIATLKQYDPEFNAGLEQDWRATLASGVEYMKAKY